LRGRRTCRRPRPSPRRRRAPRASCRWPTSARSTSPASRRERQEPGHARPGADQHAGHLGRGHGQRRKLRRELHRDRLRAVVRLL